jgi:hypothetical protein
MKGDFARVTFDPTLHFTQVLHQQGRVLLEADWNEQGAIQLNLLRTLITDLVGACWAAGDGFVLAAANNLKDWTLTAGHFYVDGILCINEETCTLAAQPHGRAPDDLDELPAGSALWLDVWERHLSCVEAPWINDSALEGVDTASRSQVVWQVRTRAPDAGAKVDDVRSANALRKSASGLTEAEADAQVDAYLDPNDTDTCAYLRRVLGLRTQFACPMLRAWLGPIDTETDACILPPEARYRGCENQLYRVEIHRGGNPRIPGGEGPTFKWSRENGSVVFPVRQTPIELEDDDNGRRYRIKLGNLGRDARLGIAVHDRVELLDDTMTLAQRAQPLLRVVDVDEPGRSVTVVLAPDATMPAVDMDRHPLLRRWDQRKDVDDEGTLTLVEEEGMELEDGVFVAFEKGGLYANGDYWVIPARAVGQGVLDWPKDDDDAPRGKRASGLHHYAVLGTWNDGAYTECCCRWPPLCSLRSKANAGEGKVPPAPSVPPAPVNEIPPKPARPKPGPPKKPVPPKRPLPVTPRKRSPVTKTTGRHK